ncbi:MAG: hypothetical protein A2015_17425 [Spirochaetes bacterium GWF1_31_7]|nr:MAG: hypothetical protein A2Y30_05415 [Spirochaetes bacterium GWE1_32_154]OHD46234.1 MAG: hypothetical protein A2Y29_08420 [Spirochaetes bacterium GWE2_31_10]OHD48604.1 MAG: hypothetical protein A2015_17425 [Spirochaetes bacterium GWF1_31_7]OHD81656.1 MAG: hypothetical protein A2355_03740 [Spirochaetes bacterium RIFOXYB1_FULL_32_8]HBD93051.1 hypothetical protein [Spirochaetia bacterium]
MVKRGSVVLIKYPFTDLTGTKVRPAIIITPDKYLHQIDDVSVFLYHQLCETRPSIPILSLIQIIYTFRLPD